MRKLSWIDEARQYVGLHEVTGWEHHNKTITRWLKQLGAWWRDDETPWCGTFVASMLEKYGRQLPKHWYRAKAYLNWGTRLKKPAYGCVGIKSRKGGGHVTFIVGETKDGYLVGLGGNQNNSVNLAKFKPADFIAYAWPPRKNGSMAMPYPERYQLPLYQSDLTELTSES